MENNFQNIESVLKKLFRKGQPEGEFFNPSDEVWDNISAHLPPKRKRRIVGWWIVPALSLMVGSYFFGKNLLNSIYNPTLAIHTHKFSEAKTKTDNELKSSISTQKNKSTETKELGFNATVSKSVKPTISQNIETAEQTLSAKAAVRPPVSKTGSIANASDGEPSINLLSAVTTESKGKTVSNVEALEIGASRISSNKDGKVEVKSILESSNLVLLPTILNPLNSNFIIYGRVPRSLKEKKQNKLQWFVEAGAMLSQESFISTSGLTESLESVEFFVRNADAAGFQASLGAQFGGRFYGKAFFQKTNYQLFSGHSSSFQYGIDEPVAAKVFDVDLVTPLGLMPSEVTVTPAKEVDKKADLDIGFDNFQNISQQTFGIEGGYKHQLKKKLQFVSGLQISYSSINVTEQGTNFIRNKDNRFVAQQNTLDQTIRRSFWMAGVQTGLLYDFKKYQLFGQVHYQRSITTVFEYMEGSLNQNRFGAQIGIRSYIF